MNTGTSLRFVLLASLCCSGAGFADEIDANSCVTPYRQLAASPPLQGTSRGDEGYPWRLLYGYCLAQFGRFSLHQDWVVSYLDARQQGDAPAGTGVSLGTDLGLHWHPGRDDSVSPYFELGGGLQYAAGTSFPAHGSRWMFTINSGIGILIPLAPTLTLNAGVRYLHISNAGLLPENAGYDAFHLVIGARW